MSATGLDVFDKTLQTTNIWLDEIMATLGPDRQVAWHVLGAVLHALRDRLQIGLAVHLGAQLPLLVRGLYYDQWHPSEQTLKQRSAEQFLDHVSQRLTGIRTITSIRTKSRRFGRRCRRTSAPCGGRGQRGNASNLPLDGALGGQLAYRF